MAKVVESIKVELYFARLLSSVEIAFDTWPDHMKDKFASDWNALEAAGAEIAEVRYVGGRVVAYPSDDFTQHCVKYGIHPA